MGGSIRDLCRGLLEMLLRVVPGDHGSFEFGLGVLARKVSRV